MKAKSKSASANPAAAIQKQLAALQSQITALARKAPAPTGVRAPAKAKSSSAPKSNRVPSDYSPGTRKLALWLSAQKGTVVKDRFYQQACKVMGIKKEQAGCVFAPGSLFHISSDGKAVGLSEPGRRILAKIKA